MVTLASVAGEQVLSTRRIEILGVFGAGKSTLAKRLVDDRLILAEQHERNPFWGDDDSIKALGYLAYDLSFLLQHAQLVANAKSNEVFICDWSFASDQLWASMRLGKDLFAYEVVHRVVGERLPASEGYLYLRQSADTIVRRLGMRSRAKESSFLPFVSAAVKRLDEFVGSIPAERVLMVSDDVNCEEVFTWLEHRKGIYTYA